MTMEGQPVLDGGQAEEKPTGLDALREKIASEKSAEADVPRETDKEGVEEKPVTPHEGEEKPAATAEEVAAQVEKYVPNYKFKVHGTEKEFDDWAKALVKDKKSEDFYREIMTKVHGLEHIKQDRESLREQMQGMAETTQKYQTLSQNLDVLTRFVQTGNYDEFFKSLQIPEKEIIQWAAKRLQYSEMTPEQKAEYDRVSRAQSDAAYYGQQSQQMQQQLAHMQHSQRMMELDQHLSSPDLSAIVAQYDQRMGKPGAFRQAVQDRGVFHYTVNKKDVPVADAVNEVLQMIGMQPGQQAPAQTQAQPPANGQAQQAVAQPQAPTKKPVIPNTGGGGSSPVKPVVKSLADIKRIRDARAG